VGPNGAGKTTLLHLAVGLTTPTVGAVRILGVSAREEPQVVLPRVGFVAQEHPLYRRFRINEMLRTGAKLNPIWDAELARDRLERLQIPLDQRVGTLSGGQQAQVALTLALAKRPELLLLDEPVASLDPVARREFMNTVMEAVSDSQISVVFSSHILADLERVCDYVVILAQARTLLAAPIDEIVASHVLLTGPRSDIAMLGRHHEIVRATDTHRQTSVPVRS